MLRPYYGVREGSSPATIESRSFSDYDTDTFNLYGGFPISFSLDDGFVDFWTSFVLSKETTSSL